MITSELKIVSIALVGLLFSSNIDARGGGRGGGRGGSRGRGGVHGGGGGLGGGGGGLGLIVNSEPNSISSKTYSEPYPSLYGKTFNDNGPPENSYIYNNYYRNWDSDEFLISSLFYGAGMQEIDPDEAKKYYNSIGFEDFYRKWDEEKDKEWRASTRAPYFENKIPGQDKIFPVSAVVGAATAFGLVSLLPINVPQGKPLMYCGSTDLIQSPIQIDTRDTYVCTNKTFFQFTCETEYINKVGSGCKLEKMQCDLKDGNSRKIYCLNGSLLSTTSIFCNSTKDVYRNNLNKTTIVKCYDGQLPISHTAFIPTTTRKTEFPLSSTTPHSLSLSANVHILLLKLMGKTEVLETITQSYENNVWKPEAMTIPLETTTQMPEPTTTNFPYVWMEKLSIHENGTEETIYRPVPKHLLGDEFIAPSNWYKVYTTSTEPMITTTRRTRTTKLPYVWMRKIFTGDNHSENVLRPVTKSEVELAANMDCIPINWVKVPTTRRIKTTTPNP